MIPFITEEVWTLLGRVVPERGIPEMARAADSVMIAEWPRAVDEHRDEQIELQFKTFQSVLGGLREIRSSQNIAPRKPVEFHVRCDADTEVLLKPMSPYFESMAKATPIAWGASIEAPATNASFRLDNIEVFIDLKDLIDRDAEIERNLKLRSRLTSQIEGKEKKLSNENFVSRAPANIVEKERANLEQLKQQLATIDEVLEQLRNQK